MKHFWLALFFLSFSALSMKGDGSCDPNCTPPKLAQAYADAGAVLVVRALKIPSSKDPVGSYRVLQTIKAKKDISVPKTFELRATFGDCKKGLFLPPSEDFVVFLNKGEEFHLLPCRAREILVESGKVRLEGEQIKLASLSKWFDQRIEALKREDNDKREIIVPTVKTYCVEDEDCVYRHTDCLVHECSCPSPVNKNWWPECGQEVKFFRNSADERCSPCPKAGLKCVKNTCISIIK